MTSKPAILARLKRHTAAQMPASATVEDQEEQPCEIDGERAVLAREIACLKGDLAVLYAKDPENP